MPSASARTALITSPWLTATQTAPGPCSASTSGVVASYGVDRPGLHRRASTPHREHGRRRLRLHDPPQLLLGQVLERPALPLAVVALAQPVLEPRGRPHRSSAATETRPAGERSASAALERSSVTSRPPAARRRSRSVRTSPRLGAPRSYTRWVPLGAAWAGCQRRRRGSSARPDGRVGPGLTRWPMPGARLGRPPRPQDAWSSTARVDTGDQPSSAPSCRSARCGIDLTPPRPRQRARATQCGDFVGEDRLPHRTRSPTGARSPRSRRRSACTRSRSRTGSSRPTSGCPPARALRRQPLPGPQDLWYVDEDDAVETGEINRCSSATTSSSASVHGFEGAGSEAGALAGGVVSTSRPRQVGARPTAPPRWSTPCATGRRRLRAGRRGARRGRRRGRDVGLLPPSAPTTRPDLRPQARARGGAPRGWRCPLREPMRRFAAGTVWPGIDARGGGRYFRDVADHLVRVRHVIDTLDGLLSTAVRGPPAPGISVQQNEDMRKISAGAALVVVARP